MMNAFLIDDGQVTIDDLWKYFKSLEAADYKQKYFLSKKVFKDKFPEGARLILRCKFKGTEFNSPHLIFWDRAIIKSVGNFSLTPKGLRLDKEYGVTEDEINNYIPNNYGLDMQSIIELYGESFTLLKIEIENTEKHHAVRKSI